MICLSVRPSVQVFTKSGAEQQLVRRALYLKQSIEAALQKHEELHIDYKSRVRRVVSSIVFDMNYIQPYTKLLYMCTYLIYSDRFPILKKTKQTL